MANSMEHWNGDQMCVLDIETTGLDPNWHEIVQIALVPLDSNCVPRRDALPFYIEMIPDSPERMDDDAMSVSRLRLAEIVTRGHDQEKSKDLLIEWVKKLKLPCTKFGNPKRILLLGHNISFDIPFLKHWLGLPLFNDIFDSRIRDTMITAAYLNDRAAMHGNKIPFNKINLSWLANQFNIQNDRAHDALQDCITTAAVYKKLLEQGLIT